MIGGVIDHIATHASEINETLQKKTGQDTFLKYSKPSIIRQLWLSATNLPGHFAITPASKLP